MVGLPASSTSTAEEGTYDTIQVGRVHDDDTDDDDDDEILLT